MNDEHTWEDAIEIILSETEGPLHYTDITEQILSQGLRTNPGATPMFTVLGTLSNSLKRGDHRFRRVSRGVYMLHDYSNTEYDPTEEPEDDDVVGPITSFGMFWRRSGVPWRGKPRILGQQTEAAADVDFADQLGVYLLHDRDRVIYVGKAEEALHRRLQAHTRDRLSGRWDRFSWFGLRPVDETGRLLKSPENWNFESVVVAFEALLIESVEPPLNRKRGDKFTGIEYLQVDANGTKTQAA